MTTKDIAAVFGYRKANLPHLIEQARQHDPFISAEIVDWFLSYGWIRSDLLGSNTEVIKALKLYVDKGPRADDGPGDSKSKNKRCNVIPASLPDGDFPANHLDQGKRAEGSGAPQRSSDISGGGGHQTFFRLLRFTHLPRNILLPH